MWPIMVHHTYTCFGKDQDKRACNMTKLFSPWDSRRAHGYRHWLRLFQQPIVLTINYSSTFFSFVKWLLAFHTGHTIGRTVMISESGFILQSNMLQHFSRSLLLQNPS